MKRVITALLAVGICVGSAAAQRGMNSSRPYHRKSQPVVREVRRQAQPASPKTTPNTAPPSSNVQPKAK